MKRVIGAIVLLVAGAGNGNALAAEPVPYATCVSTMGTCLAYVGKDTKNMLRYTVNSCKGPNNTWATNKRCPVENRLGICKTDERTPNELWTVAYKTEYISANVAKNQCEHDLRGKWYPQN